MNHAGCSRPGWRKEGEVGEEGKGVGKLKNCKTAEELQRGQREAKSKYFHGAP